LLLCLWAVRQHSLALDRACAAEPEAVYRVWQERGCPRDDALTAFVEGLRAGGLAHMTVARGQMAVGVPALGEHGDQPMPLTQRRVRLGAPLS